MTEEEIMVDIGQAIKHLSDIAKCHINLNYSNGKFAVFASFGNDWRIVPGTVAVLPERSLARAFERWNNRSPEKPFQ